MESRSRPASVDAPASPADPAIDGLGEQQIEAEFTLESRVLCPHCQMAVESLQVVRLLRNKVNFVSTLPRRGHVMACPNCHSLLTGALGGFL